jgi:preprotein translocase subunit SecG
VVHVTFPSPRPTWTSTTYLAAVAGLATAGFVSGSPAPIVLTAVLALPASIVAVPCYYLVYGLLALVTGANPSSSSGSGSGASAAGGSSTTVTADDTATWFAVTTHALGVLALVVAAAVNVLLVRAELSRRRGRTPVA